MTIRAMAFLKEHGTGTDSVLPQAAADIGGGNPTIAPSFAALAEELLSAFAKLRPPTST